MSDWKEYKLGELNCKLLSGFAFKSQDYSVVGIPLIKIGNIQDGVVRTINSVNYIPDTLINSKTVKFLLNDKDVLIAMTGQGSVGRVGRLLLNKGEKAFLNQRVGKFVCDEINLNIDYLFYILTSPEYKKILFDSAAGSGQPNLSPEIISNVKIPYVDYPTQTAIAEILSSLDDKIELNNQINKDLEALAQALFKQWFIDFEFPNENGEPYRSSGGEMVDSELGEIPKGWKVGIISDFFEILSGFPFKSENFNDSGEYKIATIKNVQDGKFITKTDNCINELPLKMPKYIILNQGDVLLSLTGNVGRTCFVQANNFLLNQRVAKIQLKGSSSTAFPYYFFRRSEFQQLLISIAKGTAQLNLSPIEIKTLKIAFPSCFDLISLDIFDSFFQQQLENEVESFSLSELRDTLLPKLISGELVVSDIQTKTL